MEQTRTVLAGGTLGFIAWLGFRSLPYVPDAFACSVSAVWIAIGLVAMVKGRLQLTGRGGKSPVQFTGLEARVTGFVIVFCFIGFAIVMGYVENPEKSQPALHAAPH